jgi:hypothetical protein
MPRRGASSIRDTIDKLYDASAAPDAMALGGTSSDRELGSIDGENGVDGSRTAPRSKSEVVEYCPRSKSPPRTAPPPTPPLQPLGRGRSLRPGASVAADPDSNIVGCQTPLRASRFSSLLSSRFSSRRSGPLVPPNTFSAPPTPALQPPRGSTTWGTFASLRGAMARSSVPRRRTDAGTCPCSDRSKSPAAASGCRGASRGT